MNESLCEKIREAFAGVKLGNGVGLHEAQGLDDYEDPGTCASYRANDEKEDWGRIPAEEMNHCCSSLSFFDAEGMRYSETAQLNRKNNNRRFCQYPGLSGTDHEPVACGTGMSRRGNGHVTFTLFSKS